MTMTPKRFMILAFISEYIATHGYPPSLRDIMDFMAVTSTNAVSDHLRAMEKLGVIRRTPGIARSIVIVDDWTTNPVG